MSWDKRERTFRVQYWIRALFCQEITVKATYKFVVKLSQIKIKTSLAEWVWCYPSCCKAMEPIVHLSAQVMMKCSWQAETTIMQTMFLAVPDTSNSQTRSVAKQGMLLFASPELNWKCQYKISEFCRF